METADLNFLLNYSLFRCPLMPTSSPTLATDPAGVQRSVPTIPNRFRETEVKRECNVSISSLAPPSPLKPPTVVIVREASDCVGFDEDLFLVREEATKYLCAICCGVCRDPMETECGHIFCSECLRCLIRNSNSARVPCPIDRLPINRAPTPLSKFANRPLLDLQIRCPNHSKGCEWVSALHRLQAHLETTCEVMSVKCSSCDTKMQKKQFTQHLEDCPGRIVNCPDCGVRIMHLDLKPHHTVCPMVRVPCANLPDCTELMFRKDLAVHVASVCRMRIVPCQFGKEFGCHWHGPDRDLSAHMKDTATHLSAVVNEFIKFKREMSSRVTQLEALTNSGQDCRRNKRRRARTDGDIDEDVDAQEEDADEDHSFVWSRSTYPIPQSYMGTATPEGESESESVPLYSLCSTLSPV